jgi:hypothetical protein
MKIDENGRSSELMKISIETERKIEAYSSNVSNKNCKMPSKPAMKDIDDFLSPHFAVR